jgi:Restriction endonuclease
MANFRSIDMLLVDDLFKMHGGYVLRFSDRTFAAFFEEELGINIDDPKYSQQGGSKAKRLRYFLQTADKATAVKALKALWEYRETMRQRAREEEKIPEAERRFGELIAKLEGAAPKVTAPARSAVSGAEFSELFTKLMDLASMAPNRRGYAFEKYLKDLFDAFGLEARAAFRLVGEQIDGSFLLGSETYLLEAKWQNELSGAAELHAFHGKIDQKAAWSRGVFISYSGFSEQGLIAFGRGKRIICVDGLDLSDALRRQILLDKVLERKVRHAAETGVAFARVRDLF